MKAVFCKYSRAHSCFQGRTDMSDSKKDEQNKGDSRKITRREALKRSAQILGSLTILPFMSMDASAQQYMPYYFSYISYSSAYSSYSLYGSRYQSYSSAYSSYYDRYSSYKDSFRYNSRFRSNYSSYRSYYSMYNSYQSYSSAYSSYQSYQSYASYSSYHSHRFSYASLR